MSSLAAGSPPQADSANLHAIKEAFRAFGDDIDAGLDLLLRNAHEDCEFRPYIGNDQVIRGPGEIRRYYDEARAAGTEMSINPTSFHEVGDEVIVHGSIRVATPGRRVLREPAQLDLHVPRRPSRLGRLGPTADGLTPCHSALATRSRAPSPA